MERSKKNKCLKTFSEKKTRKKCFIRLSPTSFITHENENQMGNNSQGNWYSLDDLYLLVNTNCINPETGTKFKDEDIEKIRSLYENYDTEYIDISDFATKSRDIDPIYHNIEELENTIDEQNIKIEENYSQILNLMEEIQNIKQKHLRI